MIVPPDTCTAGRPLRVGLLGASWVAQYAILEPARARGDVVVVAVAASDRTRAVAYAQAHGIANVADDYRALVEREDVDLVYVGLTPSHHLQWTVAALAAGKHVLCEKPFAMNADEARQMTDAALAHGRLLLEAWHYRFHPLMLRVQSLVDSRILGPLHYASARFHAPIPYAEGAFRWQRATGGGALLDTGGYTVHVLRTLLRGEPRVLTACSGKPGPLIVALGADRDVDVRTRALLQFDDGVSADIDCAMDGDGVASELCFEGEHGRLAVHGFALPQYGCSLRLTTTSQGTIEETGFPGTSYEAQLAHVVDVMAGRVPPCTGGADAVANLRVLDAIRGAAIEG